MPRDQETTSESVPVGTRTGAWPADTTTTGPDDTTVTNGRAFADRDVADTATGLTDPATGVDADDATARDGSAGTSPGADPSIPAPEGEWVAGSKGVSSATDAGPVTDPVVDTDPTRVTVPDLGDPDLDAVPDAAASQSTGAAATGAAATRLGQLATGAQAAPPAGTPGSAAGADAALAAAGAALVTDADGYRASWVRIQSGFVDDPRGSVTEAAELITQLTSTLVSAVQERERTLRGAWDGSGDADTENLRNVLRDYRSFFERLIGM
jgi:hypothetical protein